MTGRLTTHILDLARGTPAQGVVVELWQAGAGGSSHFLKKSRTNADGRLDSPLLYGVDFQQGYYELRFYVGDYYRSRGEVKSEIAFLECVPVRFGIADTQSHYHVPLLISPGGYSTYRGS